MDIDERRKNRADLKSYFVRNAIPTESNFAELIESQLNQRDDGIVKPAGDPLSIEAAGDDASQKKAINFYLSFSDPKPKWSIGLRPRSDPAKAETGRPGFGISDGAGRNRLFIDEQTGNLGIGTNQPARRLDVAGSVATEGLALARHNENRRALFTATEGDFNHALYNDYSNVDGEGRWDGAKWNVFAGLKIRTGAGNNKSTVLYVANNVGIGHEGQAERLDVAGRVKAGELTLGPWPHNASYGFAGVNTLPQNNAQNYALLQQSKGNGRGRTFLNSPVDIRFRIRNQDYMRLNQHGWLGLGVQEPSHPVHVTTPYNNNWQALFVNGGSRVYMAHKGGYGMHINTGGNDSSGRYAFEVRNNKRQHLYVRDDGYIGINTAGPQAPLHVNRNHRHTLGPYTFIAPRNRNNFGWYTGRHPQPVAGKFEGSVWCTVEFITTSDARIKKIEARRDPRADLAAVRRLRVTDYSYLDQVQQGEGTRAGLIAQEVESVLPGAVAVQQGCIPDVYSMARETAHDAEAKTLLVTLDRDHGLAVGERVKLVVEGGELIKDVVETPSKRAFRLSDCEAPQATAFVYGREVEDLKTVNHDQVFAVGLGAIQALGDTVERLSEGQARLERRCRALEQELAALRCGVASEARSPFPTEPTLRG